jgi:Na+-driven multidrug efflux pump
MMTQLLRSVVFRVSAAWLFATYFDLANIWWFQSFAAFCGSFVALAFFILVYRRIKRNFALEPRLLTS